MARSARRSGLTGDAHPASLSARYGCLADTRAEDDPRHEARDVVKRLFEWRVSRREFVSRPAPDMAQFRAGI